jgi:hypothetical protein
LPLLAFEPFAFGAGQAGVLILAVIVVAIVVVGAATFDNAWSRGGPIGRFRTGSWPNRGGNAGWIEIRSRNIHGTARFLRRVDVRRGLGGR